MKIGERIQGADWKLEKHVPVIECPAQVAKSEWITVNIGLGKAVAHPNTTEHHIRWIKAYFSPDGDTFTYDVGDFQFHAHGESAKGANQGPVYTHHEVSFTFRVEQSGTLHALAYCNIHGLWESEARIETT